MSALIRYLLVSTSIACGLLHAACTFAAEPLPEYTVKTGYLYNFAMLTEWPSEMMGESLEVCIAGNDSLGSALKSLHGKTVNNRQIKVHMLDDSAEANSCHVLYIAEVERSAFAQLKRAIAARPVLTITDNEQFAKSGVAIFLRTEGARLVFEIDANVAKHANLNISARLLRLARGGGGE